ncbi:DNA-binding protein [Ectopseudomonas mendocina]|uniref:DNA-binding protein n=1 Tax=Ectopseudomonas mendocina TaxID=300 RepID=A0ABZ2RIJ6_ECTME
MNFLNMDEVRNRALALIREVGPKRLSEEGGKNYERWRNISSGKIRISTEEVGILAQVFPEYALWLISGKIEPENGHRSPEYDAANSNLPKPSAG